MVKERAWACASGPMLMVLSMKIQNVMRVNTKMARDTAMDMKSLMMVVGTLASSHVTRCTGKARKHGQMAIPTLDLMIMTRSMGKARTHGHLAQPTMDLGRIARSTDKARKHMQMATLNKECLRKANWPIAFLHT